MSRMKCLSLFSGAGGLDLGLTAAGYDVIASIECDRDCCDTLRANGSTNVFESAVENVDPLTLRRELHLEHGELDLLAAGPPCQPFSKSAFWAKDAAKGLDDSRSDTLRHLFDFVDAFRPKALLLENVEGFVRGGGLDYAERRLAQTSAAGQSYALHWQIVDAATFGVPQHRKRFIGVAITGESQFVFPSPTHGKGAKPLVTAWDACSRANGVAEGGLAIRGRWAELVPSIPEGRNYLWHTDRGGGEPLFGWRTRYWSFLSKLSKTRPSPTIVASPSQNSGPFHWDNRLLATSELASIQTFPVGHIFCGDRVSRQRQIGNAVPPLLAATLGKAVASHLGHSPCTRLDLQVGRVEPVPAETAAKPVHEQYLRLRGHHVAHPGTGKGPKPRPRSAVATTTAQAAIAGAPLELL
jgi:DNA (cytosine-5)-methyltransferase 1